MPGLGGVTAYELRGFRGPVVERRRIINEVASLWRMKTSGSGSSSLGG